MKNLFGAAAPTNRVLGSFKFLVLIVLVAIGFTSCKDQSKLEVSPETELTAKVNLQGVKSNFDIGGKGGQERRNFDIGGNQTGTRRYCELCSGQEVEKTSEIGGQSTTRSYSDIGGNQAPPPRRICKVYSNGEIGGGKNSNGGLEKTSETGGRGSQGTTGEYTISDIGGKGGKGTSTGGENYSSDIGGKSTTGEYSISDIGGKSSGTTGNYTLNVIEGKRDMRVIRRILEPFSADIGGRGSSGTGL
jgi:hypothetical protein